MRIEEFRDKSNNFIEGYTIKITSEISYLKPPTKVSCIYAEFSIEEGSIKTGCMNWSSNTGKGTMYGMEAPFVLISVAGRLTMNLHSQYNIKIISIYT